MNCMQAPHLDAAIVRVLVGGDALVQQLPHLVHPAVERRQVQLQPARLLLPVLRPPVRHGRPSPPPAARAARTLGLAHLLFLFSVSGAGRAG